LPLTYASIAPHGDIIPGLAPRSVEGRFLKTRQGMTRIAKEIALEKPDTVIIATPHNLRLGKNIGIVTSENSSGELVGPRGRTVMVRAKCDREFALELLERAEKRGLPVIGANYGTADGKHSNMPMDWGTLVPLWFIVKHGKTRPKIVVITPSREIPLTQNHEFGRLVAELTEQQKKKRFVFVASADQAHTHRRSGPYAFNKAAAQTYDRLVVSAIRKNRLRSIMDVDSNLVERAKPDSLWQMAMLAGVMSWVPMRGELFSYDVPTYYGMACAGFHRID
jgi:aromatic ring-opening dioxygenase LigB subunit